MHIHTSNQAELKLGIGNYSCNWGAHIAGLYETEKQRDEIILGFLEMGFIEGDLQLYCPVEQSQNDFIAKMKNKCPDCSSKLYNEDYLKLYSAKQLYYPEGIFSPEKMDEGLNSFYIDSQKNGPKNIRATAEMVWALDAIPGIEHLMVYESRLNYFIKEKPWISICMYNISKFDGLTIIKVLQTHPYTISGGIVTQNPYYQDPNIWLKENAPEYIYN